MDREAGNQPAEVARAESDASFLQGGGNNGALVRTKDWRNEALGPAQAWPQSLRTALDICLSSRFPIALYWGPDFLMLYNDDLLPMVGANKHPWAFGKPAREVLAEIWSINGSLLANVVETGTAIWSENLLLALQRSERPEAGDFTFTYSPVETKSGVLVGSYAPCSRRPTKCSRSVGCGCSIR